MDKRKIGALALLGVGLYFGLQYQDDSAFVLKLKQGDSFHYQLQYSSEGRGQLHMTMPKAKQGITIPENTVHIRMDSQLQFDVLQVTPEGYQVRFIIEPQEWVYDIPHGQEIGRPEQIVGTLEMTPHGQIETFHLSEIQYQQYGFAVADILGLLEFDAGSGQDEWQGQERSFQGEAPVRYERRGGGTREISLHKSYGTLPSMTLLGAVDYSVSATRFYQSVKAERQRQFHDGHGADMSDMTRLELKPGREKIALKNAVDNIPLVNETLRGTTYQKKVDEAIAIRRVGQKTAADVKAELEALGDQDPQKKADVYMLLLAYLQLHPEAIEEFTSYLVDLPYSSQACRTVAAVFSDLGTPDAQKALMKAIEASDEDLNRKEKMIAHLGIVEQLTPEAENKIYDIASAEGPDRIKGAAELAVGVVGGNHLAQGRPAGVERALQYGENRLKESTRPAEQEHALRIIGNVGAAQQVTLVKPYLNAPVPSTKREAIRALRAVNSEEAHGILIDILKNDSTDVMRHAAIESLSSEAQSPEVYDYLKAQLFVEKDDRVIRQIVTHLVNMRKSYPDVKSVLEDYLKQCGKTSVCGFTSSALASM
jgi:hypothetical protein